MNNLRSVLSIVLSKIPSKSILCNEIQYDCITMNSFVKLAGYYVKNYSNDELENLFEYIQNEYEEQTNYIMGYGRNFLDKRRKERDGRSFSVFDAILVFAACVLREVDGEPVCQYEHMLRWRMTSHELDEDVFTTAYLAFRDARYINTRRDFSWRPIIRHNNDYLNRLLAQGMADNHFHLKGSAPQFPLSWISMMNNVVTSKFRKLLEEYSKHRLSTIYYTGSDEEHLYISYLKAALIRVFLFSKLTNQVFALENYELVLENQDEEGRKVGKEQETYWLVDFLLREKDRILFYRDDIQNNISYFKRIRISEERVLDYALTGDYNHGASVNEDNKILSGERWFMYAMFQHIYSKDTKMSKYFNMFYAYIVIKEKIRSELVQTNDNIGFDNFARYQDRKEDFIDGTQFEQKYIELAVRGTLNNQNILNLEARIAPKRSARENCEYIKKFDRFLGDDKELQKRYFYVFHFIKEKDDSKWITSDIFSRHYRKRLKLREQAMAITRFREKYPNVAKRVRGIDACAKEIGCRPEVFAQTYRYLRNHIVYPTGREDDWYPNKWVQLNQLFTTYHIGEDYLDVIDGLRAIDEAINFLQMDCGSRFGHALALGIDVDEYYRVKTNRILINQQCYLDNLVWIYYKIKSFGLHGYDDLLLFIEQEYSKYFRLIYGNYISDSFFQSVMRNAREYFKQNDQEIGIGYSNTSFYFRISEYYGAWKLRGDNPICYINGYFQEVDSISEWDRYAVNRNYPLDYKIRYNPECAYLYFLYHYNGKVKEEGEKVIEVKIDYKMIQCIKEVQRGMQERVARKGIGIETNPSSNFLIGLFKRYDKHPIFRLYNLGLETEMDAISQCPQMPVCINTDDQGIFSTYLENEYALLALALEKAKDENGKNKYSRALIYQWIDNVRKFGINLSFAERQTESIDEMDIKDYDNFVDLERRGGGQYKNLFSKW